MLVLIAGITGHVGQHLARAAIKHGLSVRGLGRSPQKLDPSIQIESFVTIQDYYDDTPQLTAAMEGVEAVIVANAGHAELQLDAQLLLLRTAERSNTVRVFHAQSWSYDWRTFQLGEHEMYDPFLMFARQAALSVRRLRPLYLFTGVLGEVLFGAAGHHSFAPQNGGGIWDPATKTLEYYGMGDEKYYWTAEQDAAELSIALILSENAEKGGYYSAFSGELSPREMVDTYTRVKGKQARLVHCGTVPDLEQRALKGRESGNIQEPWLYIGAFYQLFVINGRWTLEKSPELANVPMTSLKEFLGGNASM
ncbi:hypothetical protein PG999_013497 [Apiospora kogelbergensis]|uniref:NAD(P)-binding domain-containing protein n=1 Tax=Apiospora kogelbergensis TaxID=1337665 RepID=A0AAW0Q7I7_9PEZI